MNARRVIYRAVPKACVVPYFAPLNLGGHTPHLCSSKSTVGNENEFKGLRFEPSIATSTLMCFCCRPPPLFSKCYSDLNMVGTANYPLYLISFSRYMSIAESHYHYPYRCKQRPTVEQLRLLNVRKKFVTLDKVICYC